MAARFLYTVRAASVRYMPCHFAAIVPSTQYFIGMWLKLQRMCDTRSFRNALQRLAALQTSISLSVRPSQQDFSHCAVEEVQISMSI
eukprot:IDg19968t1